MSEPPASEREILHSLDLAMMGEWDAAKAILEPLDHAVAGRLFLLVCELEQQEGSRKRSIAVTRHQIGNALAISQANLEAMLDGVLEPTVDRLRSALVSLSSAGILLDDLRRLPERDAAESASLQTFDICALIQAHVAALSRLAAAKNVTVICEPCSAEVSTCTKYRGDAAHVGQMLRNVLMNVVRYTPPSGTIGLSCNRPGNVLTLVVRDTGPGPLAIGRLRKALGSAAHIESSSDNGAVFTIQLPIASIGEN